MKECQQTTHAATKSQYTAEQSAFHRMNEGQPGLGIEGKAGLVSSWILASRQPHSVASGRTTHSKFCYTISIRKSSNHVTKKLARSYLRNTGNAKTKTNSTQSITSASRYFVHLLTTDGNIFKQVPCTDLFESKTVCRFQVWFTVMIQNSTCLGAYSHSAHTQHGTGPASFVL